MSKIFPDSLFLKDTETATFVIFFRTQESFFSVDEKNWQIAASSKKIYGHGAVEQTEAIC